MNAETKSRGDWILAAFVILIIVGAVADILDIIFYFLHCRGHGIGWFQGIAWSVTWQYLTTFPGLPLTALGVAPYVIICLWCTFQR